MMARLSSCSVDAVKLATLHSDFLAHPTCPDPMPAIRQQPSNHAIASQTGKFKNAAKRDSITAADNISVPLQRSHAVSCQSLD